MVEVASGKLPPKAARVSNALGVYDYTLASAGAVLRYDLFTRSGGWISLLAEWRGQLHVRSPLIPEFDNLVGPFLPTDAGFGWYVKAGAAYYFGKHFFADLTAYYYSMNSKFTPSNKTLDGSYFLIAISLGVALL